jgi:hypothetical protein
MALDQQSGTIQLLCAATEVSRAPQSQMCRRRQSWMVQLYIRLLTGRFQVRILVAEPPKLEVGHFQTDLLVRPTGETTRVLAGRFHASNHARGVLELENRRFETTKLACSGLAAPANSWEVAPTNFSSWQGLCTWPSGRQPRTCGHCPPSAAPSCPTRGPVRPGHRRHWRTFAGHALRTVVADKVDRSRLTQECFCVRRRMLRPPS